MALPLTGPISISQLRAETCSSSGSLRALSALAGKTTADSMSEFYGYNHPFSGTIYTVETYDGNDGFSSSAEACADPDGGTSTLAYSNSSVITVGTELNFSKCLDQVGWLNAYNTSYPYYRIGTSVITLEDWDATYTGYVVRTVTSCSPATPATLSFVWTNNTGPDARLIASYNNVANPYFGNDYPYGIIVDNIIITDPFIDMDVINFLGTGVAISVYINNNYVTTVVDSYGVYYTIFDASPGNDYLFYADSYGPAGEM